MGPMMWLLAIVLACIVAAVIVCAAFMVCNEGSERWVPESPYRPLSHVRIVPRDDETP